MSYAAIITEMVMKYPEMEIIDAQKLYNDKFKKISEQAFYQTFSRMAKSGEIKRISKGIYCIPKRGRFGITIANEENILRYLLGHNNTKGVIVGYRMYNKHKLTTQLSKRIEVYSNIITQDKRNVNNIVAQRANIRFDNQAVKMIELLEVLENYKKIEDLNPYFFIRFLKENAKYYDEKTLERITDKITYKKCTMASLKNVLNYFGIENSVRQYLNGTSSYDAIRMEEWDESASK